MGQGGQTVGPDESLDHLAGDWRIFQLRRGHRYSTDDLLTAWYGCHLARELGLDVSRYLDLGAGIGSVAMMLDESFDMPDEAHRIWDALRKVEQLRDVDEVALELAQEARGLRRRSGHRPGGTRYRGPQFHRQPASALRFRPRRRS